MQMVLKYPDFTLGSYLTLDENGRISFVWAAHQGMRFDITEFRRIPDVVVTSVRIRGHYGYQAAGKSAAKVGLMSVPYENRQEVSLSSDFDVSLGTALPASGDLDVVASYVIPYKPQSSAYALRQNYSPPRYYAFVPVSGVRLIIEYESATSACTPPTGIALDREVAEDTAVLYWTGAQAGTNNPVDHYLIQYRDSGDGDAWGEWMGEQAAADSPVSVTPNPERGAYRQYRVCTVGTAGAAYQSDWTVSGSLRTNIQPGRPGPVIPAQAIVEGDTVALSWTAAADGLSAVTGYQVERQVAGGTWELLSAFVDGTAFEASMQDVARGQAAAFRVCAVDTLGGVSAWAYSEEVFKNRIPPTPVIVWPASGALCLSRRPVIGVTIPADAEGQHMTLQLRNGANGAWTDVAEVSASGCGRRGYRLGEDLSTSATGVFARLVDALGAAGEAVSVTVRRVNPSWQREISSGTVIADQTTSHQADLAELLAAVNARREWFGAEAIEYATEVGCFANWLPQMRQLWSALAELYELAGETTDAISQDGNYPAAATVSLIRTLCEGL
ncbi:MAG: fibronectin type III domain-containing protein [Oscillospiraceae bacterium]|nr:fibronectin type III domain-containing protein [Oscillospiraceae bacterium]